MNELYHHGVKGQKWGVRRYQNEDGSWTETGKKRRRINTLPEGKRITVDDINRYDDITIKKGTKFNRLIGTNEENFHEDLTKNNRSYVSVTKDDLERYTSFAVEGALFKTTGDTKYYADTYKTKKKIKVAGEKYLTDYVLDKIGDKKVSDIVTENNFKYDTFAQLTYDKVKNEKISSLEPYIRFDYNDFELFNNPELDIDFASKVSVGQRIIRRYFSNTFYMNQNIDSEVVKDFKSKGYSAILDLEDASFADFPLIVLDPSEVMSFDSRKEV